MLRNLTFASLVGAGAVLALTHFLALSQGSRKRYAESEDDCLADIIKRFSPALVQARNSQ